MASGDGARRFAAGRCLPGAPDGYVALADSEGSAKAIAPYLDTRKITPLSGPRRLYSQSTLAGGSHGLLSTRRTIGANVLIGSLL